MPERNFPRHRLIYTVLIIVFAVFSGFVYTQAVPETNAVNPKAVHGKTLWQQHNCSSCHQLYGLGGYLGPDLTNTLSTKGKGKNYAAAIMKNGTQVMPNFHLNDTEIEALLAFLEHADESGNNRVHSYQIGLDGTITSEGETQK
ncbi:c-type cytochrome [Adhaeribacter terreus]|uniref:C-type cytochrome n=1 Tax=Adhaeribacter terreus TaxID=529703 RepID=A0ABW0E939_9BACT